MFKIVIILFVTCFKEKLGLQTKKVECGYKQCPQTRDGALNVHLIAHSHMDAGWVKTFDEYYYGVKTSISSANVQLIFHSVLSELLHDKRRKFTFSESGYFWRWWKEQRPATRATFRSLVQEGRVEFAGGGWVQSDEATTDYMMLLDQYTWGLRKLNDTLGPCGKPKAAWQIDSYGHTREHTSLLAQMGYDGLFIGRVDHKEREAMLEEDRMEFMWRGSDVLGKMSDIMTHTLYNLYNAPEGFCFDFLCNDEPIVDDLDTRVYNADRRVNDFVNQIERQAKYYVQDNIMVTMGGDFTYQSAANWYMNMDKLINHVNTHAANMSDVNVFYSTPSCYLKALYLYGRRDKAIYTERGEHMPYGSDASTYWTGFYTSRPSMKYLARQAHTFLQIMKQLTVIARMGDSYELHLLRHAVALITHHDAITGTSQQHVANDFVNVVNEALEAGAKKVSTLLSHLTPTWGGTRRPKNSQQFVSCHQMNLSQCSFAETQESLLLIVYNPLSIKTYYYVRLPAIALNYAVRNSNDEEVEYQLLPLPSAVINLPGRNSNALQELVFEAENVPPLGYLAYYITPVRDPLEENEYAKKQKTNPDLEIVPQISNEYLKVAVNKDTGLLEWVQHVDGTRLLVRQNFFAYGQGRKALQSGAYSFRPDTDRPSPDSLLEWVQHVDGTRLLVRQNFFAYGQGRKALQSGAYSFRPDTDRPSPIVEKVAFNCVRGSLVKEIRQRFTDWLHQTLRIYRGEEFLELEWVIGPVPIGTDLGKEIVSIFSTNISNRGDFYTDSNMRQAIKRSCLNDTAGHNVKKSVASCYYPVTGRLCILAANDTTGLCLLPDRTQGGTSYEEGELEVMVHRRLLTDDGFGLDESLNEEEFGSGLVVRGKHRLYLGNHRQEVEELTFSERMSQVAFRWRMEPWQFLSSGDKVNRRKWQNVRNKRFSALKPHGLPRHIRILTLEPWKVGSVLLRLENTLEKTERVRVQRTEMPEYFHINVNLRKLFQHMQIKSVRETTLAANQWLEDARQMDWSTRYVYNGGDDGLLSEDIEYTEDKSKTTDTKYSSGRYSEEDAESRRKPPRREKYKSKLRTYNVGVDRTKRRKRSINLTENFVENDFFNNSEYKDVKSRKFATETPKYAEMKNTTIDLDGIKNAHLKLELEATQKLVTNTPKNLYRNRKYKKHLADYNSGSWEEEPTVVRKARRYNGRKRPTGLFVEMNTDDADDGVTKSIYEMYYKTKTKHSSKPRSVEEPRELTRRRKKRFRLKEYEQRLAQNERAKRRRQKVRFAEASMEDRGEESEEQDVYREYRDVTRRKRSTEKEEDEEEDEDDMDDVDDYEETAEIRSGGDQASNARLRREKRSTSTEEGTPEPEQEFVVTLRPAQIRTFVVRFQNVKKDYVA